jgi:hypothetical protein
MFKKLLIAACIVLTIAYYAYAKMGMGMDMGMSTGGGTGGSFTALDKYLPDGSDGYITAGGEYYTIP